MTLNINCTNLANESVMFEHFSGLHDAHDGALHVVLAVLVDGGVDLLGLLLHLLLHHWRRDFEAQSLRDEPLVQPHFK